MKMRDIDLFTLLLPSPLVREQKRLQRKSRGAKSLIKSCEAAAEHAVASLEEAVWPSAVQAGSAALSRASRELREAQEYLERLHYEAAARGCGKSAPDGTFVWYTEDVLNQKYASRHKRA